MNNLLVDIVLDSPENIDHDDRELQVKKIFGLSKSSTQRLLHKGIQLPQKGITYITGFSGAGKSCLLAEVKNLYPDAINIESIKLNHSISVLNCIDAPVEESIKWLSRFGLGEARVLITKVKNLSVGQKERLKLALLLWSKPERIIIDEFLSSVDRCTARIISFQFQKLARKFNTTAYIATAHNDLEDALFPDSTIVLDFEGAHQTKTQDCINNELLEAKQIEISKGSLNDYDSLKRFHYMENQIGDDSLNEEEVICIRKATFKGILVGVRVFTKIFPSHYENNKLFSHINSTAALSSRVIVHPAFRCLGISKNMNFDFDENPLIKTIFTHSSLATFFPFDLAGGYKLSKHPSVVKTKQQIEFEDLVKDMGIQELEILNDPQSAKKFWDSLSADNKSILKNHVAKLLADYDLRYLLYIANELKIKISQDIEQKLYEFYLKQNIKTSIDLYWSLLSEALHFPMQGLVFHK